MRIEAMGKDAALLRLSGIHKHYRHGLSSIHALCDIHMRVDAGEMVAVCAPSGHGKTTLLNLIGLLEPPSAGRVLLDGVDATGLGERERIDDGLLSLYVAQSPTRLGLLRFAFDALRGKLGDRDDFDVLHAPELDIATHRQRLRVATDGEVTVMKPPLRYRVRPGALTVMVPAATMSEPS